MGLSKTRKLLSFITAVIVAVATALLVFSFVFTAVLTNEPISEKLILSDALTQECEAQLDAGFKTLVAETGIPAQVFDQVKTDFPVEDSLKSAYQGQFNEESQTLYSQNMVNYFYKLCTEYLKGNKIKYQDTNIVITAEKAARIYSNAVGLQNTEGVAETARLVSRKCNRIALICAIIMIIFSLLLISIYSTKTKAYAYLTAGFCGGALAAALAGILMLVFRTASQIKLSPAIYEQAYQGLLRSCFTVTALAGLIVFAALYFILIRMEKHIYKRSLD